MKTGIITDIIFGIAVLPGMMFLFPLAEWTAWNGGAVALYVIWLYGVYALCRLVLGPMLLKGQKGIWTVAGALFLLMALTFLMSLTRVDFPRSPDSIPGRIQPHVRAMWVLLLADCSFALVYGACRARIKQLSARLQEHRTELDTLSAVGKRSFEAVGEGEIVLGSGYSAVPLPLSSIQYIESRNNYVCIHRDHQEDLVTQMSMKKIMELLPQGKFLRIHRSYIVPVWRIASRNLSRVQLIGLDKPLPVGRAYKENLK